MTTKDLRNSVEKILGNSIRCLLPSYWWKRLFHQVADTIDEVNGVDIVSSEYALNRVDAPIGSLASIANKKAMKPSECYVPTDEDSNLTDEELVAKLTRLTGLEVSFPLPDITGVEAVAVLASEDAWLGFLVISEGFCAAMFAESVTNEKLFYLTNQSIVNSLNTFLKQHKFYWAGLDFEPEDTEEYIKETTELFDQIFTIVDCNSDVYVKGLAWERLAKEGESGSASASVPSYTLYYTTYKVNGVTTMADKYINLNKDEYAKIIASQKAKENYLLQVVEIGTGEEYAPVDVELSWFSIADLDDTDGNFNVTVCSFLQRDGANQPQRRLVSFKSDGTAEYELIPTGDVKFLYYADGTYSLSAKEKAHNASAILSIKNSFDSSFTPSPIIIRYKIGSTKYLSLQGILSGNDAEGDGVSLTAFTSDNVYFRFNYDLATGEPAKAEVIKTVDSELSTTSENPLQNKVVTAALNNKVDKVEGKQLSTEDFTTALKTKLEGLNAFDPTEINNKVDGLQTQLNTLVSGDASTAIESFNEITAFLNGVTDSETLDGIIAGIEQQIAAKQEQLVSGTNIKTINGESILGEGNIEIKADIDTSTLATKEELATLQNEVIANEEVTAAALNDLNNRLGMLAENVQGETVTKEEFETAVSDLNESLEAKADASATSEAISGLQISVNGINAALVGYATTESLNGAVETINNTIVENEEIAAAALNDLNSQIKEIITRLNNAGL